jgi:hypothetical protein
MDLHCRSRWFDLNHPDHTEPPFEKAAQLSDKLQLLLRPGVELWQKQHDSDDLAGDARYYRGVLPFQKMVVRIPYENTLGGFALFNPSSAGLAPELYSFYGTPALSINQPASLYLVGNNFSVRGTRILAGGLSITNFTLLSRQLIEAKIPGSVFRKSDGVSTNLDIFVATPYGVTRRLQVPVVENPFANTPQQSTNAPSK